MKLHMALKLALREWDTVDEESSNNENSQKTMNEMLHIAPP